MYFARGISRGWFRLLRRQCFPAEADPACRSQCLGARHSPPVPAGYLLLHHPVRPGRLPGGQHRQGVRLSLAPGRPPPRHAQTTLRARRPRAETAAGAAHCPSRTASPPAQASRPAGDGNRSCRSLRPARVEQPPAPPARARRQSRGPPVRLPCEDTLAGRERRRACARARAIDTCGAQGGRRGRGTATLWQIRRLPPPEPGGDGSRRHTRGQADARESPPLAPQNLTPRPAGRPACKRQPAGARGSPLVQLPIRPFPEGPLPPSSRGGRRH